jgi:predicted acetyltransferase
MALEIRTITADEVIAYRRAIRFGFATRDTTDDADWAAATVDPVDRAHAAFEHGRIVATLHSFPTELTMPGGNTVSAGALTAVTCQPTHRRQGVLTRMISADLLASKERGEPVDILIAAEYPIYGRFGYGPAVHATAWELDLAATRFVEPGAGSVEFVDDETFRKEAPTIFERVRTTRPGMIARNDFDWDVKADLRRRPEDKPWLGFRVLCRDSDGTAQGWVNYRIEEKWDGMRPQSKVAVDELCGATPAAEARLWRYLADLDLVASVTAGDRPTDEILPLLLHDARAARCVQLHDFVWTRPLDITRLLEARRYEVTGRLVFEVVDEQGLANGRYLLDASPDGVSCSATDESADLAWSVRALGAVVLGGRRVSQLHAARWLDEHRQGAVADADAMFASSVTPWCNTWF